MMYKSFTELRARARLLKLEFLFSTNMSLISSIQLLIWFRPVGRELQGSICELELDFSHFELKLVVSSFTSLVISD